MKRKILNLLILLLLIIIPSVSAQVISKDNVEARTYIIGKYMFTRNTNENYNGVLTTRRIMLAARTLTGNNESDMIIYYKKADGTWIDALTNASLTVPNEFDIEVIDIATTISNGNSISEGIDYSVEDIAVQNYLVGKHIFTRNKNDIYDGILNTKKIMLASKTITSDKESDMIIYYKKPNGDWIDALTGTAVTVPSALKIVSIDLIPQVVDTVAPVCTFGTAPTVDVGSTATLTLTCVDNETGVATTTLSASAFTLSNSNISIANIATSNIENGRTYTITLAASESGTTTISLKSGAVKDLANNASNTPSTTVTSRKTYTLTLDANGGTGTAITTNCKVTTGNSCNVTLPANSYTYSGWTFQGWGTSTSATTGDSADTSVTLTGNTTRYAIWKKDSKTYTLSLDPNGLSESTNTLSCTIAEVYNGATQATTCSVTLPSIESSHDSWTFVGWGTSASATTGTASGATVNLGSNMTYYAIWRKNVTVTFNANGCTTANKSASMTLYNGGTSGSLVVPNATMNNGWTSLGVSESASSTTQGATIGTSISISVPLDQATSTYYYNCKKNPETYTATFNANGGNGSSSSVSCTLPVAYNGATQANSCNVELPSNSFTYASWTFNGWGTNATSESGTMPGETVTLTGNTTYYATWKKVVTAQFNANSCAVSNMTADVTLYNGATSGTLIVPNATMQNGWTSTGVSQNSKSTSNGTAMGSTISVSIPLTTSSLEYYYNCKKTVTRTLTYNANGGSGTTSPSTCNFQAYNGNESGSCDVTLANNAFTRGGYKFNGWGANSYSESGYAVGTSLTLSSNQTLYATWKAVSYTIRVVPLDQLNLSPDRKIVVYADGEEIEFSAVKDGDFVLCTGDNPSVNVYEVSDVTTLNVVLLTGETVTATIVQ